MKTKKKPVADRGSVLNEGYELVATSALKRHPRNVNRGDLVAIGDSIAENGFYGAVLAQRSTGYILAGNHRYEAAQTAGLSKVPVIWVDVDDDRALRILLVDNRTTRLGEDDQEALAALLQEILNDSETLAGTGYDEAALDALLAEVGVTQCAEGLTDEDAVPEPLSFPVTEPGDLWTLGKHRLLCGSSTEIDQVLRLFAGDIPEVVFSDPPYGISIVKGNTGHGKVGGGGATKFGKVGGGGWVDSKTYAEIANDENTDTAREFVQTYKAAGIKDAILWGGNYFTDFLNPSACWLVWDKQNTGNFADVELAWTSFGKGAKLYKWLWNGLSRAGDRKTELVSRVHPTQKPVGLFELIFQDFEFKICFDGFLGSGSTLIACEKTNRACFGCELSQEYVDIIVNRWQDFTGKQAVLESDGRSFNEIAAQRQPEAAIA
jgi:hypothetical protein